jgi:hypothetical protein
MLPHSKINNNDPDLLLSGGNRALEPCPAYRISQYNGAFRVTWIGLLVFLEEI